MRSIGAAKTLSFTMPSPTVNTWQTLNAPLLEAGWRVSGWQGPAATRADLLEVLGDMRGIYLNTEWNTGVDDTPASVVLALDAQGAVGVPLGIPVVGSGPLTWLQGLCLDATAPNGNGLSLTNGVAISMP